MAAFRIHAIPGSPFTRAACAALEEKGADYEVVAVRPDAIKRDPHLSRHPFGRVPVLEHEGFALYETQAILRYIDRVLPSPPLTPDNVREAARMDQVMNICDWYLFQGVGAVIAFQRIVGPKLLGLKPDEEAIAAAMPRAHNVMRELSRLLGDQAYFAGPALSLADLHVAPHLDFLARTPEWAPLKENRENLDAWLHRMGTRRSMAATTLEQIAARAIAA